VSMAFRNHIDKILHFDYNGMEKEGA